ncbi:hypothetical protein [Desulforamulus ferrireducens]|uniref:Uncharacterized protein n=1 Tax=Desulforamulus ferrireducens TaxID=1833852 RepID=A0A1S6IYI8_9FIRM|nr:hypothetical protein [Desulforamulus ferrireducens]AQS59844.1 hypothetical protein B0537_12575 [Desulforamulus ferrireducens]
MKIPVLDYLLPNPIEEITFDEEQSKFLLNQEEQNKYQQLEQTYESLRRQLAELAATHDGPISELISRYEDVINNLNALTMTATFREGLHKGFRLAQFFLQDICQSKPKG